MGLHLGARSYHRTAEEHARWLLDIEREHFLRVKQEFEAAQYSLRRAEDLERSYDKQDITPADEAAPAAVLALPAPGNEGMP